jgi:hypothetical protein
MQHKKEITDLVSLLKVFDINYVNDADSIQLNGLNVNKATDVRKAVEALLIPEFLSYLPEARARMFKSLRVCLSDDAEDFAELFDRIELAFDEALVDKRCFMLSIFEKLESVLST